MKEPSEGGILGFLKKGKNCKNKLITNVCERAHKRVSVPFSPENDSVQLGQEPTEMSFVGIECFPEDQVVNMLNMDDDFRIEVTGVNGWRNTVSIINLKHSSMVSISTSPGGFSMDFDNELHEILASAILPRNKDVANSVVEVVALFFTHTGKNFIESMTYSAGGCPCDKIYLVRTGWTYDTMDSLTYYAVDDVLKLGNDPSFKEEQEAYVKEKLESAMTGFKVQVGRMLTAFGKKRRIANDGGASGFREEFREGYINSLMESTKNSPGNMYSAAVNTCHDNALMQVAWVLAKLQNSNSFCHNSLSWDAIRLAVTTTELTPVTITSANKQIFRVPSQGFTILIDMFKNCTFDFDSPRGYKISLEGDQSVASDIRARFGNGNWRGLVNLKNIGWHLHFQRIKNPVFDGAYDLAFLINRYSLMSGFGLYRNRIVKMFIDNEMFKQSVESGNSLRMMSMHPGSSISLAWLPSSFIAAADEVNRLSIPKGVHRTRPHEFLEKIAERDLKDTVGGQLQVPRLPKYIRRYAKTPLNLSHYLKDRKPFTAKIIAGMAASCSSGLCSVFDFKSYKVVERLPLERKDMHWISGGKQGQIFLVTIPDPHHQGTTAPPPSKLAALKMFQKAKRPSQIDIAILGGNSIESPEITNEIITTCVCSHLYSTAVCPNFIEVYGGFLDKSVRQPKAKAAPVSQASAGKRRKRTSDEVQSDSRSANGSGRDAGSGSNENGGQDGRDPKPDKADDSDDDDGTEEAESKRNKPVDMSKVKELSANEKDSKYQVNAYMYMELIDATLADARKLIERVQFEMKVLGSKDDEIPTHEDFLNNLLAQTVLALAVLQERYHGMHNDLHKRNIFLKKCDDTLYGGVELQNIKYFTYNVGGRQFRVENYGILSKIGDMGFCSMEVAERDLSGRVSLDPGGKSRAVSIQRHYYQSIENIYTSKINEFLDGIYSRTSNSLLLQWSNSVQIRKRRKYSPGYDIATLFNNLSSDDYTHRNNIVVEFEKREYGKHQETFGNDVRYRDFQIYTRSFIDVPTWYVPIVMYALTHPVDFISSPAFDRFVSNEKAAV